MPDLLLAATAVTRRFGGLTAVNGVSLGLARGQVHAVIGTNGAGKSTLINILSGELAPSSGNVMLGGRDITAWRQPERARADLGRSYQRSTLFPELSVFENCRLAAQAGRQRFWHWWRSA
ncbi:MAG: ATP-binding cassette domain-containing protein, partial [Achromobacter pestifer]